MCAVLCLLAAAGCSTTKPEPGRSLTSEDKARVEAMAYLGQGVVNDLNDQQSAAASNYLAAARADPTNEELHFRATLALLTQRRFAEARDVMEGFCARNPKSAKGFLWLALVYRAEDLNQKALDTYAKACRLDGSSPTAYLEMANILIRQKRFYPAELILNEGIRRVEDPSELVRLLSDMLAQRIAGGEADAREKNLQAGVIEHLKTSVRAHPKDDSLKFRLGTLYIMRGDFQDALPLFTEIEKANPGNLRVKQRLALTFVEAGDREKAIAGLKALAEKNPSGSFIPYYLGEIYEQGGDSTNALAWFQKAANGKPVDAAPFIKQSALLVRTDSAAAMKILEAGRKKLPKDARLAEMSAYVRLSNKEFEAAVQEFKIANQLLTAQKLEPMTPSFYSQYAIALLKAGKLEETAEVLQQSMTRAFAYVEDFAQAMLREKKSETTDKAIKVLNIMANRAATNAELYVFLGLMNSSANRYPEALAALNRAADLAEQSPDGHALFTSMFYFWRGAAHERVGDLAKAEEDFRRCIEMDPENNEAYNYIAYMLAEKGERLDEAMELSKKSLEMDPDNAAFIDTLGWIYFMKGDFNNALKALLRAANLMPEDPTIVGHMGDVMEKTGKPDKALEYWKRSFILDPTNEAMAKKLMENGVDLAPLREDAAQREKNPTVRVRRLGEDPRSATPETSSDDDDTTAIPDLIPVE